MGQRPMWRPLAGMVWTMFIFRSGMMASPKKPDYRWRGWFGTGAVRSISTVTMASTGPRSPQPLLVLRLAMSMAAGALKILERAGTSREYAGLWRDVENYQVPAKDAELPALVEVATVESLAAAMAKIDRAYDNVKLCRKANWGTPYEHPDLNPAQEALLVKEGLRESARNLAGEYGDEFKRWLTEGEFLAQEFEDSLKADSAEDEISRKFQALQKSCRQCHDKHRN